MTYIPSLRHILLSASAACCLTCLARLDMTAARAYCDSAPLAPIEGIWQYPDDGVTVLIRRDTADPRRYEVKAIESEDTRVSSGDVIGTIEESPDPNRFRLTLATEAHKGLTGKSAECLASLSKDAGALHIKMKKRTISLNPSWILPRFWRMVRVKTRDPLDKLPAGMVKVYPGYDGNGSSRRSPRYL